MESRSQIKGFGAYVPERLLTNADLERLVDTNDEWIVQRTGIRERHLAVESEFASDLAIKAVEDLIDTRKLRIDDVDHIIVTTFTPDHFSPHVSALVQAHFGIKHAGTFDLNAGCTGFAYALSVANALVTSGQNNKVLVVAAETASKALDYTDRATCILFGDAAAACLVERCEDKGAFLASRFHTDGDLAQYVSVGNHSNTIHGSRLKNRGIFEQNGQQVYKYVMKQIPQGMLELLKEANLTVEELDWFVPHSANMRMIQTICEKLSIAEDKTLTSLEHHGNTSSASIPLSLALAQREGKLNTGDLVTLYGFGGGLTHGGVVVRL